MTKVHRYHAEDDVDENGGRRRQGFTSLPNLTCVVGGAKKCLVNTFLQELLISRFLCVLKFYTFLKIVEGVFMVYLL